MYGYEFDIDHGDVRAIRQVIGVPHNTIGVLNSPETLIQQGLEKQIGINIKLVLGIQKHPFHPDLQQGITLSDCKMPGSKKKISPM